MNIKNMRKNNEEVKWRKVKYFFDVENSGFHYFYANFWRKRFFQSPLAERKFIGEICFTYLKHSPNSGESVRKKIRVVRHVEVKILKQT